MTSSQISTFGLIGGGFLFFASLLIYSVLLFRQLGQQQALVLVENIKTRTHPGFAALVAYFSELVLPIAPEDMQPKAGNNSQPAPKFKWAWLGVLLLAMLINIWAEFSLLFLLKNDANANLALPLYSIVFAGLLFAFACRRVAGPSLVIPFKAILPQRIAPPTAFWITNIALSFVVMSGVNLNLPNWANYLLFGLWILNILLLCWNIIQMAHISMPSREDVSAWWQAHRLEVLLIALIGLAALLIRLIGLETYPYSPVNDEGEVGWEGLRILSGQSSNFFGIGWSGQPVLSFLPDALSIRFLGVSATAVRLVSVAQGTLTVISLYLLAREAFGRPVAFFSASLLAALPWHVHFSRLGVMNIGDSFYSATALWLTYRALRRGTYIDYLLPGLMIGFAFYTYLGSRLVIAMAIGVLAYAVLRQRDYLKTHFRHLAIFVFAFLIVAAPMMYSFSLHFDEFMGRLNAESLMTNNRLQQFASEAGIPQSDFITRQIQTSTTIFFASSGVVGPRQFFDTPRPYLAWWAAIFLFLGMFYVLWNFTQVRYIMLIGWFWAPVLLGSALTAFPPSHQRMLSAAPALALIVAIGLWKFIQSIRHTTRLPQRLLMLVCVLAVGFTAWQDINYYFVGEFRTGHYFEVEGNEFSYVVGLQAGSLGPDYRLLLIGDPYIYSPFANFHYLTNTTTSVEDFDSVTADTIASLTHEKGLFFAAIPSRVEELRLVQKQLPGGKWFEVKRHTQEGLLYYGYILPAPAATP